MVLHTSQADWCSTNHVKRGRASLGNTYRESVLAEVNRFYSRDQPSTGTRDIKPFHDNASAHKQCMHVQEYLADENMETLPHPSYSLELSPFDFSLFPHLKKCLSGAWFSPRASLGSDISRCLSHITRDRVQTGISVVGEKTSEVCFSRRRVVRKVSVHESGLRWGEPTLGHVFHTLMEHPRAFLTWSKWQRSLPCFATFNRRFSTNKTIYRLKKCCVGPQNKIGHPAGCRFPCWVPAEYK